MVYLLGRQWSRGELLARVGRLAGYGATWSVTAAVLNPAAGLGVYQRYRKDQLPHHVTWRQLGSGTYVVAMEPSTNRDAGRLDARARGELQHVAPGEERRYTLEIGALAGTEDLDACAARIGQLAAAAPRTGPASPQTPIPAAPATS